MVAITPEAPKDCPLCPRLVAFREDNQKTYPEWFNGAVPSFAPPGGDEAVEFLIVGLAPGLQGANKTGRPFTGDWAGDLLYATLLKFGLAKGNYGATPDDGLTLHHTMITNAVRCVPPQNKPVGAEMNACRPFLQARLEALPNLKAILCLGTISHNNTLKALGQKQSSVKFIHGQRTDIPFLDRTVAFYDSYHCSRYNTNTGRLTEKMFEDVFAEIVKEL
jgi:uracil-DNA glycosylase family 4